MKSISKIGRLFLVVVFASILFASTAAAQINATPVAVPLSFTQGESLTLTVTGATPVTFNSAGVASNAVNAQVSGLLAVQRYVIVAAYFTSTTALTGANPANTIPVSNIALTTSTPVPGTGIANGSPCDQPGGGVYPGGVLPTGAVPGQVCPLVYLGQQGPGSFTGPSSSLTFFLASAGTYTPDTYSGSVEIGASAM